VGDFFAIRVAPCVLSLHEDTNKKREKKGRERKKIERGR
jgi:hypothetical protein